MMYYYRRKTSPWKWAIIAVILLAIILLGYWFYVNYFSKIEINSQEKEITNQPENNIAKDINCEIDLLQGDVQISSADKGYTKALSGASLAVNDQIKTGTNSLAVLAFSDNSKIRLGANTEIVIESLAEKNVIIKQLKGRTYNNISGQNQYRLNSLKAAITGSNAKFEVITNDTSQFLVALVFDNNVNAEVLDNNEAVLSARLDAKEKALINFQAVKSEMLKIENFDPKNLEKEQWYKWNFELDKGLAENLPAQEPDFMEIKESLVLAVVAKENGAYLSWSVFNGDNFASYQIIKSETNSQLKYPDEAAIKSSLSKDFNSYLDSKVEKGKKYYYRVCVVKSDNKVACGNIASIETAKNDTEPPASPTLSASISVPGVNLSWTANKEEDFLEYRVLKSITNPSLFLSANTTLVSRKKGVENYLDKEVNITSAGNVYYRVCSLDNAGNSSCSNVIWVENGAVR